MILLLSDWVRWMIRCSRVSLWIVVVILRVVRVGWERMIRIRVMFFRLFRRMRWLVFIVIVVSVLLLTRVCR